MAGDGTAKDLRAAAERLDAAELLAEVRKPVADLSEAAQVGAAIDHRMDKAARFGDVAGQGTALANVYAGRARLAAALGGQADGLPGELAERLASLHEPVTVAAADAPVAARRSERPLEPMPAGMAGLLVIAGSGSEAPALALTTIESVGGDGVRLGPIPWRARKAVAAAVADGRPAAFVLGAPPAALLAGGLAGAISGDAYAMAGGLDGEGLACVVPSNDAPPIPADAEAAAYGVLSAADDGARAILTIHGACAREAQVLHLFGGADRSRELLSVEALAMEIALHRHIGMVEGGVDVLDVVVYPETGNRLAACKIRPRIGGQSKTALMAALASTNLGPDVAFGVDEDINVHDLRDVIWSTASRLHGEVDVGTIAGMAATSADKAGEGQSRAVTKWFVDSTMPPLTQPENRAVFERAMPKNLADVDLKDFLPD